VPVLLNTRRPEPRQPVFVDRGLPGQKFLGWQASSRLRSPPRTAATTSALRRMTQRRVLEGGRSAMVSGLPSGPMTYLTRGLTRSVIRTLYKKSKNQSAVTLTPQL
jgi:hypothetical protein